MPQSSLYYTDLELPTLNADGSTYGQILNDYVQGLETKLKSLSDRINAAGVGSSSTLAQIDRDIAQTNTNTSSILPDPYSGDFTTVSTWPAFNTELTALGLSPPETASEIETFFSSGDFTTFANFLDGKLDALDIIVTQAESDLSSALYDTCATATILDARTAAQSSGAKQAITLEEFQFFTTFTSPPTHIGGNVDESVHSIYGTSSIDAVQGLLDAGVLTTSFQTFYGSSADVTSGTSVGANAYKLWGAYSGESRGDVTIQAKYTGPSTVDSTSRITLRMPQIVNKENFFTRVAGDIDVIRYIKYVVRYPYPTLNCSNPSPPYFS